MKIINSMQIDGVCKVVCAEIFKDDVERLLTFNTHNRRLNTNRVDLLVRSIKNSEWKFNGATIVIDGDGVLRDGQTRLNAFLKSGIDSFVVLIVYLFADGEKATAIQKTMDKGQPRHYSQQLVLEGVSNAVAVSAVRRNIGMYLNGSINNLRMTDSELDKIGNEYAKEIELLTRLNHANRTIRFNGYVVAVLCVLAKRNNCLEEIYGWCLKVADCVDIKPGSTQYTFMRFLNAMKGRTSGNSAKEIMSKTTSIIEAHLQGNECMTKVYGCNIKSSN